MAGEKLNKSKSAVSKRISQLEKDLGVRLLNRTTRCLSLTEAGEHYLHFARKAQEAACEGEDGVTQFQNNPKGLLRISIPMSFGRLHLAPLIIAFLDSYPEIEMDVVMDDRIVDLVEGRFDLAIRAGDLQDSTLVSRRLAICRSVLCASPAYIKKWGLPANPTDLIKHNCLLYSHHRGSEWTFCSKVT